MNRLNPLKLLIVDRNPAVRKMIQRELDGFEVAFFEADCGADAIEQFKTVLPTLMTVDPDLEDMSGFEAIRTIRTKIEPRYLPPESQVPIVIVTSDSSPEERKRGFEVGASDFIIKPFLKGELAAAVAYQLRPESQLKGLTALIAEDSTLVRTILHSILEAEGINTLVAADGEEAFCLFRAHELTIDLVITDLLMPGLNGDELCRKIRKERGHEDLPIVFLSAHAKREAIIKLFRAGASDYLVKPFSKEELLARIKVHLKAEMLTRKLTGYVHELKRLSKLQNDFLSITSHDLRSPLSGILGFAELLLSDTDIKARHHEAAVQIKKAGGFLMELISDILDLGRIQSENQQLEKSLLAVSDMIVSSLNTVQHMANPKSIRLELLNNCRIQPYIWGGRQALIRVFNNLLSNAIKFTPAGGNVKVIIEELDDDELGISIIDTGIGIPEEHFPRLFDRFSKTSRVGTAGEKGTGLGLCISKELIEQHDGTISIISDVGRGTRLKISLPLAKPPRTILVRETDDKFPFSQPTPQIHILLVEVDKTASFCSKDLLLEKGYTVSTVRSGKEVVDSYKKRLDTISHREAIPDLIFMELKMPEMNALEAAQKIRAFEKKLNVKPIPIITLVEDLDEEEIARCQQMGIDGILDKPMDLEKCESLIHRFVFFRKKGSSGSG